MLQSATAIPPPADSSAETPTSLLDRHAQAALIRGVEKRLLDLFAQGKLFGTVHTCIGQEWSGVAVAAALEQGDCLFTNHRGHGHYLAFTDDVDGLIGEVMGKQTGMCGGRGGSQHMCAHGVFSNGIQGGIVPVSAGLALAQKFRNEQRITAVFIGDGTLGEGALYETLNIASKWNLPLLIVLENNLYSQSTAQRETLAGDICARATAFGIESAQGSIWDVENLLDVAGSAVRYVRENCKPFFLRIDAYRLMAHSKGDDDRDVREVEAYWKKDPLAVFSQAYPLESAAIEARVKQRIDAAVATADAAPYTAPRPGDEDPRPTRAVTWTDLPASEEGERLNVLIHASLQRNMARDPRIVLIGEDIRGPYGGAFKVTRNLSEEFPGRVLNTPISEAAIVGLGNGLALHGMKPVCEIMFGDFLTLCADQLLNHASKFRYMYNDQVRVPLIVRTPMGGKRGYGPTHSQSIEKHFLGIPGLQVLALHHRFDPGLIYDRLFEMIEQPTLVIENKLLYSQRVMTAAPRGFIYQSSDEIFPTLRLSPGVTPDVTIVCYGGMLVDVEKAVEKLFDEQEIVCEIICPTRIYPLNVGPIVESLRGSGRLLIAEEGIGFAALGAEVIAQVQELAPGVLRSVRRLASPTHPIPSCGPLEKALLPGANHVVATIEEMMSHE